MVRSMLFSVTLSLLASASLSAQESVSVAGTTYPTMIQQAVGSEQVRQVLTGTAVRTKLIVNVYTIASYIDERAKVRSAKELVAVDATKQLHLVMSRGLTGKQLADAFADAIRLNYAAPMFSAEIKTLSEQLSAIPSVAKGHEIRLTHIPKVGFYGDLGGSHRVLIKNPAFSRAVWEIYLGERNLGNGIKSGLTSRLR